MNVILVSNEKKMKKYDAIIIGFGKGGKNLAADFTFEQYAEGFKRAILVKEKLTSLLREKNFKNLDDRETVTVYTGASTIIPTISGIEDNPFVHTSTSIMELERLPQQSSVGPCRVERDASP